MWSIPHSNVKYIRNISNKLSTSKYSNPVGKIAVKAVCRSAELTKTNSFRLFFWRFSRFYPLGTFENFKIDFFFLSNGSKHLSS